MPVEIVGWALATPLGINANETWASLMAGRFITDHALVPLPSDGTSRVDQLSFHVAKQAIADARWTTHDLEDDLTALIIATSKGPIVDWLDDPERIASPSFGLSQIASTLAGGLHMGYGPRLTLSAACASSLLAIIRAVMMIQSGQIRRALVVAVESSVHPLFLGSFRRLGVLPKPGNVGRPFDQHRDGFLMSEAAGAVCLELNNPQDATVKKTYPPVFIDHFALGGTAGHLTAGDSTGKICRQLFSRVTKNSDIDLIHAHATGTVFNDPIELSAIESVLQENEPVKQTPVLYSHKGAVGHSLGAAGMVSVVINCLAHIHGKVPPMVGLTHPLPTRFVSLSTQPISRPITQSIAMASGFGGATAMIRLTNRQPLQ